MLRTYAIHVLADYIVMATMPDTPDGEQAHTAGQEPGDLSIGLDGVAGLLRRGVHALYGACSPMQVWIMAPGPPAIRDGEIPSLIYVLIGVN